MSAVFLQKKREILLHPMRVDGVRLKKNHGTREVGGTFEVLAEGDGDAGRRHRFDAALDQLADRKVLVTQRLLVHQGPRVGQKKRENKKGRNRDVIIRGSAWKVRERERERERERDSLFHGANVDLVEGGVLDDAAASLGADRVVGAHVLDLVERVAEVAQRHEAAPALGVQTQHDAAVGRLGHGGAVQQPTDGVGSLAFHLWEEGAESTSSSTTQTTGCQGVTCVWGSVSVDLRLRYTALTSGTA